MPSIRRGYCAVKYARASPECSTKLFYHYFNTRRTLYYCVLYRRRYYCNIIDVVKQRISTIIYIRNIILYRYSNTAIIFVRRPNSVPCVRDIIVNIIQAHYNLQYNMYIYKMMGSGTNNTKKKITRSFDIDAAMVGSIYVTRIAGLSPRVTVKI